VKTLFGGNTPKRGHSKIPPFWTPLLLTPEIRETPPPRGVRKTLGAQKGVKNPSLRNIKGGDLPRGGKTSKI